MHQATDGEVGHHQAVELLAHQVRGLAAQDDASAPQVVFNSSKAVSISSVRDTGPPAQGPEPYQDQEWW